MKLWNAKVTKTDGSTGTTLKNAKIPFFYYTIGKRISIKNIFCTFFQKKYLKRKKPQQIFGKFLENILEICFSVHSRFFSIKTSIETIIDSDSKKSEPAHEKSDSEPEYSGFSELSDIDFSD